MDGDRSSPTRRYGRRSEASQRRRQRYREQRDYEQDTMHEHQDGLPCDSCDMPPVAPPYAWQAEVDFSEATP